MYSPCLHKEAIVFVDALEVLDLGVESQLPTYSMLKEGRVGYFRGAHAPGIGLRTSCQGSLGPRQPSFCAAKGGVATHHDRWHDKTGCSHRRRAQVGAPRLGAGPDREGGGGVVRCRQGPAAQRRRPDARVGPAVVQV